MSWFEAITGRYRPTELEAAQGAMRVRPPAVKREPLLDGLGEDVQRVEWSWPT